MSNEKEPSELDITLVQDFANKLHWAGPEDGSASYTVINLPYEFMQERKEALQRVINSYARMEAEISRLVLEKHHVD